MVSVMFNLAKLDDGFDESPTVMVGDNKTGRKQGHTKTQLGFRRDQYDK